MVLWAVAGLALAGDADVVSPADYLVREQAEYEKMEEGLSAAGANEESAHAVLERARARVTAQPAYQGDAGLRTALLAYITDNEDAEASAAQAAAIAGQETVTGDDLLHFLELRSLAEKRANLANHALADGFQAFAERYQLEAAFGGVDDLPVDEPASICPGHPDDTVKAFSVGYLGGLMRSQNQVAAAIRAYDDVPPGDAVALDAGINKVESVARAALVSAGTAGDWCGDATAQTAAETMDRATVTVFEAHARPNAQVARAGASTADIAGYNAHSKALGAALGSNSAAWLHAADVFSRQWLGRPLKVEGGPGVGADANGASTIDAYRASLDLEATHLIADFNAIQTYTPPVDTAGRAQFLSESIDAMAAYRLRVAALPPFEGDAGLRDATVALAEAEAELMRTRLPTLYSFFGRDVVATADLGAASEVLAQIARGSADALQTYDAAAAAFAGRHHQLLVAPVENEELDFESAALKTAAPDSPRWLTGVLAVQYQNGMGNDEVAVVTAMNALLATSAKDPAAFTASYRATEAAVREVNQRTTARDAWLGDDGLRSATLGLEAAMKSLLADDFGRMVKILDKPRTAATVAEFNASIKDVNARYPAAISEWKSARQAFVERWDLPAFLRWSAERVKARADAVGAAPADDGADAPGDGPPTPAGTGSSAGPAP